MHLAIIMDGNGRWATKKGLTRIDGHKEGSKTLKKIALYCSDKKVGVDYLTVYAFSIQNWGRPREEIFSLFSLVKEDYFNDIETFNKANIRIRTQGYIDVFPKELLDVINNTVEKTKNNTGLVLTMAVSYGGREEILDAVNEMLNDGMKTCNMKDLVKYIEKDNIPNPDLVIRTSGEYRVSNFLLWQSAYSEYLFTDKLWPDFNASDIDDALQTFSKRTRRFGLIEPPKDKQKFNLPDEDNCRKYISHLLERKHIETLKVDKYKGNILLRTKYNTIINNLLKSNIEDKPESISKEAELFVRDIVKNQPEKYYTHINSWTELLFLTDNIIDMYDIKKYEKEMFIDVKLEDVSLIDVHKTFRKYITSQDIEERLKQKLYELDMYDMTLYKSIIKNDIKEDYISRILIFVYGIYPILQEIFNDDMICLLAIVCTIFDDIEDDDNKLNFNVYELLETIIEEIEQNSIVDNEKITFKYKSVLVDNTIFIKIKTAIIYLLLFVLKRKDDKGIKKKFSFAMLFRYLQLIL